MEIIVDSMTANIDYLKGYGIRENEKTSLDMLFCCFF